MSLNNFGLNGLDLGTSVITKSQGKIKLSGSVGTDLIIPENVSDSSAILRSDCEIKISDIQSGNNSVTVTGTSDYTVVLLGEDGTLASVKTREEFELKDFIEGIDNSSIIVYGGCESSCSSRLINPRKLNLSSEITVCVFAMNEQNSAPDVKGAESIEDELSLNKKYGSVTSAEINSLTENDIPASLDVFLDGNLPPMSEIIYSTVKAMPSEIAVTGNKITVKTKVMFSSIYRSEEGNIFAYQKPFVLEKSVETDNADSYDWFAEAVINDLTAEVSIDSYGEAKLIEVDFTYDILLNGIRNVTTQTVLDAYSTVYECITEEMCGESVVYKRTYGSSLSVNAFAERKEISAENVRSVLIGDVVIENVSGEYCDDKKRLVVEANTTVTGICENNITSDDDPKFSSITFEYPFKCEIDVGEHNLDTVYNLSVTVSDIRFRCDQNKIYCDFENNIKVSVCEKLPHSYVKEIVIDKNVPVSEQYAPITLCYPCGAESIWDIAKYYRVTTAGIVASNNLENEDISGRKVLLIPSLRKRERA